MTDMVSFYRTWNQNTDAENLKWQRIILAGVDEAQNEQSRFISKCKRTEPIASKTVNWFEEQDYPKYVTGQLAVSTTNTLTISGYLFRAAVTAESITMAIRVGTVLRHPTLDLLIEVTDVTGLASAPFTCTVVGHAGTSDALASDSGPVIYSIETELWNDETEANTPRALNRIPREVGCQIFAENFYIGKTTQNLKAEAGVMNETERQLKALTRSLARKEAIAILRGAPQVDESGNPIFGNKHEYSKLMGLTYWAYHLNKEYAHPTVYVNLGGAAPTLSTFNDLATALRIEENAVFSGTWGVVCHPLLKKHIREFQAGYRQGEMSSTKVGYRVDYLDLDDVQNVPIIDDIEMPLGCAALVDFDSCEYGPFAGDEMDRKHIATKNRTEQWLMSFQRYGLVLRNARPSLGYIYNAVKTGI